MHLKLDRLMTKNENGIRIQIYSCLIAYLILQLIEIPREFGKSLLDKLRYLQAYMCQEISLCSLVSENLFGKDKNNTFRITISKYVKFYYGIQHFWS